MSNPTTISVTACDNELIFVAFQWERSYEILHIQSGNFKDVNVTLTIKSGIYPNNIAGAPLVPPILNGINESLKATPTVYLPTGSYQVSLVGINWGGPTQFKGTINGTAFNSNSLPETFGAVFSLDGPVAIKVE